jgi:hypothetical protein
MANMAIEVRVGNDPSDWKAGFLLYFSDGEINSKMPPEALKELVSVAIETELEKRGMSLYDPFGISISPCSFSLIEAPISVIQPKLT